MSRFLKALEERVLLGDGAMGTRVQAADLDVDKDYLGCENCTEILNRSRADLVRDIHAGYLEAGSDAVQTNSFGGSPITLAEFDLQDEAFELNRTAGILAREAIERFKDDGRERFVLGSIGPGTKLPSLGHIAYQPLEDAFALQSAGLIAGGIDAFLIETCQDPLQVKAAVNGAKRANREAKADIPIMVQVTVETTGTMLVGTDIAAAATIIDALDVPVIGLNCATGPQEMAEHVHWLAENWRGRISIQPNAGLPELVDGQTVYPLAAPELATWLERFLREDGISFVGGCCGTQIEHIQALDAMLRRLAAEEGGGHHRPRPKTRSPLWTPSVASLYGPVALRQENAFFAIGERCNANGSKKFRELQDSGDWDGCVEMGRDQVREGSHSLDVCTAFVGRDEVADMTEVVSRMRGSVDSPLVIDSTELIVLEAALKLYGGKAILNSINFEDGEEPAEKRMELARRFGTAVIALTIDEEGMAKTVERKVEVAKRLHDFACVKHGLPASDLMFDPLTFTICTGNEDDRKLGLWTLEAIERIAQELPECQIVLGLSNISFGLNPAARHVLNSVFLDHAVKRGMTGAIVHVSKIMPLHQIPENEVKAAEDLIFDRRSEGYDPLQAFMALFEGRQSAAKVEKKRAETVEERLKERIIDGDRKGLDDDLAEAMKSHPPLDIINTYLLDGMKVVGELFGAGKMQLPFVLQSAETMKAAVAYLEPHMERVEGQEKGTIVLATVKGDVHDIGKNLVDIILTNNGYKVVNLGIKQPIATIIQAAEEHKADAIGMSGLLVKSTVIMRENLEEMTRLGMKTPVMLGGAALTRNYVETDCAQSYGTGQVAYARDAFDGLNLMNKVIDGGFDAFLQEEREKRTSRATSSRAPGKTSKAANDDALDKDAARARRHALADGVKVPEPPFWGSRVIARVPVRTVLAYLNEMTLYQFQWGFRKSGRTRAQYRKYAEQELKPILKRVLETCEQEDILVPQAVYGYWQAAAEGNDVVLFGENGGTEVCRFKLPRQAGPDGKCLSDYFRDIDDAERDVIGLQVVTMGSKASDIARDWFEGNRYQDYLYLHGLSVEMAEAMAEYVHKRIRAELGFASEEAADMQGLLKQEYRGSRYSFGYPACPNLADQRPLLELLGAERIGVSLTDQDQLDPEQSTSAIVLHHPKAKYFNV
ncbi:methionine synthase [Oceanibaculum indicum]|uniref:Methionine synthase n=1 Tax=Oceanibaculum indicum P24 TaxID=1207063 RepID=K2K367_9PROT|nr:methionine synthase [Oceanibaculum indicum]EKE77349.1 B12-dependent homocysteine-N5-methyltetrahydrofolate transmethylase [Oceanibaculum indicum P24]